MAKEKIQMVDDDEVENVGIMSGFMDDIDEIMNEIMEEEKGDMSEEEGDMARVMGRTPDSPEILMNNLRGNMRSIDARREELAEMVGYNAAAETPDEVLAMLQPVLAQQEMAGIASMMAPPQGLSPNVSPRDALSAPPAMPEGVASLPMDQGPMGMPQGPMPPAAPAPAPMPMKDGGIVQYFQDGTDEEGVTAVSDTLGGVYPPEVIAQILPLLQAEMARQPMAVPASATERAKELEPMYSELLGVDKEAAKAQFLMNLGQAALRYAGNVGPSGERLTGSPIARLAAGFSDVPAAAAKAGADMAAQERQARLAALQGAQAEIASAQDYNKDLLGRKLDIYSDILKQKPEVTYTLATQEQKSGLPEADQALPWQISSRGQLSLPGGRPPVGTTIDVGGDKFGERLGVNTANQLDVSYIQANSALQTRNTADELLPLIEEEGAVFAGPLSGAQTYVNRLAEKLNISDGTDQERLNNTVSVMQSLARFELQAAEAMRGQGQITEKERDLIRRTAAGQLTELTQDEVATLVKGLRKVAQYKIDQHNLRLTKFKDAYADDENVIKQLSLYELTDVPLANFDIRTQADSLLDGMGIESQQSGN